MLINKPFLQGSIILFVCFFSIPAFSSKIIVSNSGKGDYTDIQTAINSSNNGDKIYIGEGTYVLDKLKINKNISIIGQSKEKVKIILSDSGVNIYGPENNNYIEISNISFDFIGLDALIYTLSIHGNVKISNCNINAGPTAGVPVSLSDGNIIIKNSVLTGAQMVGWLFNNNLQTKLINNTFILDYKKPWFFVIDGLEDSESHNLLFINNIFYSKSQGNGSIFGGASEEDTVIEKKLTLSFKNNLFVEGNLRDIKLTFSKSNIYGKDPLFLNFEKKDFRISKDSVCIGSGINGDNIGAY